MAWASLALWSRWEVGGAEISSGVALHSAEKEGSEKSQENRGSKRLER